MSLTVDNLPVTSDNLTMTSDKLTVTSDISSHDSHYVADGLTNERELGERWKGFQQRMVSWQRESGGAAGHRGLAQIPTLLEPDPDDTESRRSSSEDDSRHSRSKQRQNIWGDAGSEGDAEQKQSAGCSSGVTSVEKYDWNRPRRTRIITNSKYCSDSSRTTKSRETAGSPVVTPSQQQHHPSPAPHPLLATQLVQFGREMLELLKTQPGCRLPFNKLIPAYQHHFGRQFRVADYGYKRLIDLCEAVPNTLQVTGSGASATISIPKRTAQTVSERERTQLFARQVVDLIRSGSRCRVPFNNFAQTYHQHFGHRCRLRDYGFKKLIDLLNAIPDVVEVFGEGADKVVQLTEVELSKVMYEEVREVLRAGGGDAGQGRDRMPLDQFLHTYIRQFGYARLDDYGVATVREMLHRIPNAVQLVTDPSTGKTYIESRAGDGLDDVIDNILLIFMDCQTPSSARVTSSGTLTISGTTTSCGNEMSEREVESVYHEVFGAPPATLPLHDVIHKHMSAYLQVTDSGGLRLSAALSLVSECRAVLMSSQWQRGVVRMRVPQLAAAYAKQWCCPVSRRLPVEEGGEGTSLQLVLLSVPRVCKVYVHATVGNVHHEQRATVELTAPSMRSIDLNVKQLAEATDKGKIDCRQWQGEPSTGCEIRICRV